MGAKRLAHTISRSGRALLLAVAACATAGCGAVDGTSTDEQQVNAQLLKVLTTPGKRICVDRGTYGEPLAIFRTMLPAPDPARRPLYWTPPGPLQDGRVLSRSELVGLELGDKRVRLPEHAQDPNRLPFITQTQLNALAREASLITADSDVRLRETPLAPRATVRWWVRNRLDSSCDPIYTVSKPVFLHDVAFLSVTAGHQGSTYAFHRKAGQWAAVAKWSTWLY